MLAALAMALASCDVVPPPMPTPISAPASAPEQPDRSNPTLARCEEQGGRLETRAAAGGSQTEVCVFPDGSECEAGALLRGECLPGGRPTPSPTLGPEPPPEPSTDALLAQVQGGLPADAFEGLAVLPLAVPEGGQPLWVVYSHGMRNYGLDPTPSHFVALYTRSGDGWQELDRIALDAPPAEDAMLVEPLPDYVDPGGVQQVDVGPARIWLSVDGGAGAHSGVFQLLRFDGEALKLELASSASSPGAGYVTDVNRDGQNDVVLDTTEAYIFCYACGVRHPYFQVYTWLEDALVKVEISDLASGQDGTPLRQLAGQAVALAQAGLWQDALATIDAAVALAGADDPPTMAGSLRWNQALIKLNHDAQVEALQASAYPLLSAVFYGDYAGAVDRMRLFDITKIFSPDTPLVKGTVAEGWEEALSTYLVQGAADAIAIQPDLAPAYFVRAWGRYLADPSDPQVREDLAQAATLAPADPLFPAALAASVLPAAVP